MTRDRTYYVRTDGNDQNDGLANDSAHAFRTIQRAVDIVQSLDFNFHPTVQVTIQVANGIYDTKKPLRLGPLRNFASTLADDSGSVNTKGAQAVEIKGDPTTPSNVVITNTADLLANITVGATGGTWRLNGVQINARGQFGNGLKLGSDGRVILGTCNFHSESPLATHIAALSGSALHWVYTSDLTISGSARRFLFCQNSLIDMQGNVIKVLDTPAFGNCFIYVGFGGVVVWAPVSSVGNITGRPYIVDFDGVLDLLGPAAQSLPTGTAIGRVHGDGSIFTEGLVYHGRFFYRDLQAPAETVHALRSGSCTVAQLPDAASVGAGGRTFVTDAISSTRDTIAVGGGAYKMPVYSDGITWLIG